MPVMMFCVLQVRHFDRFWSNAKIKGFEVGLWERGRGKEGGGERGGRRGRRCLLA